MHRCKAKGEKWTEISQSHRHSLTHCASDKEQEQTRQTGQSVQTGPIAQDMRHHRLTHIKSSKGEIHPSPRGSLRGWQPWSGGIGARALNPITAGPLPATLLGPLCVSSQPMCSSEHPTKTPGPIGLSPPSSEGRSGLVHPGTDDRQAASSTEYYYTSRSYTYEQKQQERALTWRCVPSSTGTPQICVPFWTRLEVTCLFSLLDANSRSQHYTS